MEYDYSTLYHECKLSLFVFILLALNAMFSSMLFESKFLKSFYKIMKFSNEGVIILKYHSTRTKFTVINLLNIFRCCIFANLNHKQNFKFF